MASTPTVAQVMQQLERWGNESMRKTHVRAGSGENVFGVLLGKLRPYAESLGTNHALGLGLWETGNVDARLLACMVMDPQAITEEDAGALLASVDYVTLADELVGRVLVEAPCAVALRTRWMESTDELARRAGWKLLVGHIARGRLDGVDVDGLLARVERELPDAPYRAKEGMNHALVEIGIRLPAYTDAAVALGERLGRWDTWPIPKGCYSSYPPEWIAAVLGRKSETWKARAAQEVAARLAVTAKKSDASKAPAKKKSAGRRSR